MKINYVIHIHLHTLTFSLSFVMGQYYNVIFLAEKQDGSTEIIRVWIEACPSKLMEHSYLDNEFLTVIEYLLSHEGMCYRSRIVWAGDYADTEAPLNKPEKRELVLNECEDEPENEEEPSSNLYELCKENGTGSLHFIWRELLQLVRKRRTLLDYIVNHTKKQFVHMKKNGKSDGIHPLPLLVSEGNGRGGGDYFGRNEELCGTWARDIISVEETTTGIPSDYTELVCDFYE